MAENQFFLQGNAPQTTRQTIFDVPETTSEYLKAVREQSFESTTGRYIEQALRKPDTGRLVSKQEALAAQEKLGLQFDIPETGISYDSFNFIASRQLRLQRLERTIQRKPDTYVSSALGLGAMLGPQIADPVNVITSFVPLVGPARYSKLVASAGSPTTRFLTRAAVGGAEAGVATAALEPLNYSLANAIGDDYTAYNSFMNIAFGVGFGGTLSGGGGLLADAWGGFNSGVIKSIPREERAAILEAAAQRFMRDGDVDIEPILSAATKRHLLYDLNQAQTIPGLKEKARFEGPNAVAAGRGREEYLKDNPQVAARIASLEDKLATAGRDRALNDYNDAESFDVRTPGDAYLVERKKATLEKRYGKGFKEEADDYTVYKAKREQLEQSTDKRRKRTLEKEIAALDAKYEGRLSKAFDAKRTPLAEANAEYVALRNELNQVDADVNLGAQMKTMQMQDAAIRDFNQAKSDFASGSSTAYNDRVAASVDKIDEELAQMKDPLADDIDEDVAGLAALNKEFEERTGIVVDEIDDAAFNVADVISSMRNFANCLRR